MSRVRQVITAIIATAFSAALFTSAAPARATTHDPDGPGQWGLTQVGAPQAWARTTGAGVPIGIVDTGVHFAHEDLARTVLAHPACLAAAPAPARLRGS